MTPGEANLKKFKDWASTKSDADFRAIVRDGKLSRAAIVRETGFGRSVFQQNPDVAGELTALEDSLRERGVLPPKEVVTDTTDCTEEPEPIRHAGQMGALNQQARLRQLEIKVQTLAAENAELKRRLDKLQQLDLVLGTTGRLPR